MRSVAMAALASILLASCSATDSTQTAPESSPTSVTTSSSPSEGPAISCPNPEGGGSNTCLGAIDAGTYRTKTLEPQLKYTVPDGWSNMEDLPGNFLLLPPGSRLAGVDPGTSDYLGVYSAVAAPGRCSGFPAATVEQTFDGLVGFLRSDPKLEVSNVHDVAVGGLKGVVMDLAMTPPHGDGCPDGDWADFYVGVPPSSLVHAVIAHMGVRIYLLRNGKNTLAIEVTDAPKGSDYKDWYGAADDVIRSFGFTAPA